MKHFFKDQPRKIQQMKANKEQYQVGRRKVKQVYATMGEVEMKGGWPFSSKKEQNCKMFRLKSSVLELNRET